MSWKDRRVLITGLSGFVGSYMGEYLVEQGANVFGLVRRRADGHISRHIRDRRLDDKAHLLTGDLLDPASLLGAIDESQPAVIFHLAAQSSAPRSFQFPGETYEVNSTGTLNLLEAIRLKKISPTFLFAGTSEEYGLVFGSETHYLEYKDKHGPVFPEPASLPELPIKETNPLRPISPYGVAKVHGDYLTRNYALCWDIPTIVSRAFNHEGAGRGNMFVTATIARQVAEIARGDGDRQIVIGNVNPFRDWSHVKDIVKGYCLLADKGAPSEIYNQGSGRTNSVLSYILLALEEIGAKADKIESFRNGKTVQDPLQVDLEPFCGRAFEKTKVDTLMLGGELSFGLADVGIWVHTDIGKIAIRFDPDRFRPLEVPVLLPDTSRISGLGFQVEHSLSDIVKEQIDYFLSSGADDRAAGPCPEKAGSQRP